MNGQFLDIEELNDFQALLDELKKYNDEVFLIGSSERFQKEDVECCEK